MKRYASAIFAVCIALVGAVVLCHAAACEADEQFCFSANDGSEP